ncbi:MAG: hypothetical protein UY26_C0003G0115 [Candidatus Jorgensenbacteria bacterium GW2011_GWA1_48_13]|uniref:CBU-0592-like domain-containing protein n=1 Tax=Candidatus Jorgensenbacteria bacterium GW2011_GWB1_50_10 TaxID=1618665 RepID=A0A0G1W8M9_9BACT|nr:MAG: hypothetical protein UY26_C0003G0115 [Candidatus Jorgensenbacteria bacterium GW2011_GWA1_48_13]KKW15073.1 MAG: hypothetical protein UY55_C0002G0131 [Candidatus Jorgensenbacteria bacterium GW2011_GWB1_50_10]
MEVTTLIGSAGAAIILIAFFLNQSHKLDRDSIKFDILNLIGSGLLIAYAILLSSIPFTVLNGIWFLVSLRDIFSDLHNSN